jgi:hypothetical protein
MIGDLPDLTFELCVKGESPRSIVSELKTDDQIERNLCSLELSMEICALLWDSRLAALAGKHRKI